MAITRYFALLLAAIAAELTAGILLPALTPGHHLVNQYVSTAGVTGQPYATAIQVIGLGAVAFHILAMVPVVRQDTWHVRGPGLLLVSFLGVMGIGLLFRCDPGCELATVEARIHYGFGLAAFILLGLGALWSVVHALLSKNWTPTAAIAGLVVILDLWLLASDLLGFLRGAAERLTVIAMMAWSMGLLIGSARQATPSTQRN